MKYASVIQKQRTKVGMTQEELAMQIGAPLSRIQKWESGDTLPNLMQVPLLCAALHMSYESFFSIQGRSRGRQHRHATNIPMYQISYLPVMCNHTMQHYRLSSHMSLQEFAEKCSVSEKTAAKWETGNAIPKLDTIPLICDALHIKIWQFFE